MHLPAAALRRPLAPATSRRPENLVGSPQASAEIQAYIAARDLALAEAERDTSNLSLNRAFLANQLVENCLQPARPPYQAQSLPEAEARHERQRCAAAKTRLAQLRATVGTTNFPSPVAA